MVYKAFKIDQGIFQCSLMRYFNLEINWIDMFNCPISFSLTHINHLLHELMWFYKYFFATKSAKLHRRFVKLKLAKSASHRHIHSVVSMLLQYKPWTEYFKNGWFGNLQKRCSKIRFDKNLSILLNRPILAVFF